MRVTTNAILRNYKSNLSASMTNLDTARTRVMTGRKFSSAAEDPASALRAALLERKYVRNNDYISTVEDVLSRQDAQEDAAYQISVEAMEMSKKYGFEALNATNQDAQTRQAYAAAWRGAQQNMLKSLNATYGDQYLFAGADANNQPFELITGKDGKQILTYRGIDVSSGDQTILEQMAQESVYVDIGFGLDDGGGSVSDSNAFDTALSGLKPSGYGVDEQGNPKNMILLAGQIADALEEEPFDAEKYKTLLGGFDSGREALSTQITDLGTKTQFLETTKDRLEDNKINLTTELDQLVNVDYADAISDFSWAQYAYNAALKVGTNILSPSFIDFMS